MPKPILKPQLRRKLLLIAVFCLLLALMLELYTFGLHADLPGRLLRSFFVLFVLSALTLLAIVPGVSRGVDKLLKR
ncbi:DUF2798 domain-containing protein [Pontibacter anaerobius]|uniref:DUF2798 domain-containing protein n=1 Tax=Pontibacter anaerobius TaxID=2993940 RepID=A0ABT3R9J3_9BACT|nr:DUF2798 domain-containing protein [Pontibacter anaerobius]MCX2738452.1 DUF2798 domain-containing protein [Pontibacter anaerobius]